jgi:streptogramin lyase
MTVMSWFCASLRSKVGLAVACLLPLVSLAQGTVPSAASVAPAARVAPVETSPASKAASPSTPAPGAWTLVKTLALPTTGAASLDRRGTLYLADQDNNLRQLARDGQPLNTYSPAQPGHVAVIEAWNQNSLLVFYDDRQQVLLLDRFLAPLSEIRLADYLDGTVRTATLAPDGLLWLLDESTLTLREFDPQALRMVQSTPLDLIIGRSRPDFRFLRQYQNNVYLVDHTSGIFVFDNLGNYRKKLPFMGLDFITFRGDELVYLSGSQLHFFHLYNFTERTQPLPPGLDATTVRQVLLGDQLAYFLTTKGVSIYQL